MFYFTSESGHIYQSKRAEAGLLPWTRLPNKSGKEAFQAQCAAELKPLLFDGRKVFCNVTRVSSSGMSRCIQFYVIEGDDLHRITHLIAGAGDYPMTDEGLRVSGCGMDMRFAVLDSVYVANNLDIQGI
jgi:hypothetical protein